MNIFGHVETRAILEIPTTSFDSEADVADYLVGSGQSVDPPYLYRGQSCEYRRRWPLTAGPFKPLLAEDLINVRVWRFEPPTIQPPIPILPGKHRKRHDLDAQTKALVGLGVGLRRQPPRSCRVPTTPTLQRVRWTMPAGKRDACCKCCADATSDDSQPRSPAVRRDQKQAQGKRSNNGRVSARVRIVSIVSDSFLVAEIERVPKTRTPMACAGPQ
jgi:hypothetical protein